MSEKRARQVRKEVNRLRQGRAETAKDLVLELMNAPLKYRLKFAFRILFRRGR